MFRNFIVVTFRQMIRNRGYTLVNLLGLALALTISMLSIVKICNEFSFEKGYQNYSSVYRINQDIYAQDQLMEVAVTPGALASAFSKQFPEVENYVRLRNSSGLVKYNDIDFELKHLTYSDSTIFDVFGINVLIGNGEIATGISDGIAISATTSRKIFGDILAPIKTEQKNC